MLRSAIGLDNPDRISRFGLSSLSGRSSSSKSQRVHKLWCAVAESESHLIGEQI